MKRILTLLLLVLSTACLTAVNAQEIALFDSKGEPRAYIDADDSDCTIYLWNGTPVAYLDSKGSYYNVYGFNGEHLGWYDNGRIVDHDGYIVGFKKGAVSRFTKYEGYKSYKKTKPYKSAKRYAPAKAYTRTTFSSEDLTLFLKRGAHN